MGKKRWLTMIATIALVAVSTILASAQTSSAPYTSGSVTVTTTTAGVIGPLAGESVCNVDVSGTWTGPMNVSGYGISSSRTISLPDAVNNSSSISSNGYVVVPVLGSTYVSFSPTTTGSASIAYTCSNGLARLKATTTANVATTDDNSTNATYYPAFTTSTNGSFPFKTSSGGMTFKPSNGRLALKNLTVTNGPLLGGGTTISAAGQGGTLGAYQQIGSTDTSITSVPATIGATNYISAAVSGGGGVVSQIFSGVGGSTSGNLGGYIGFATKGDGNSTDTEGFVVDHNAHISCPQSCYSTAATSPASCAALAACATVTFTFPRPYTTPIGGAEIPFCSAPSIADGTTATTIWLGNIKTVSSTAVTYQYAPTTATSAADSLTFYFNCYDSSY